MMKRTKNLRKRGLALFLALVMCFGLLQTTAWAEDEVTPTDSNDVTVGDSGTTDTKDDVMDDPSGDDVDKDTPETNVTPDTDDSVPKTEAGGVDYEKDEREKAGDTTPSDDPDHAGYPWAEDKEWPRTEDVVIDGEHDVTVPVKGETTEGDPSAIEGGTSETDTWTGEGDAHIKWEEHKKDDEGKEVLDDDGNPIVDKKVEVDVDVTVKGEETSTDTTTSDALGVHETTTVNGSETVKTEIDRTDTVEDADEVDLFDPTTKLDRPGNEEYESENKDLKPDSSKPTNTTTSTNLGVPDVTVTDKAGGTGTTGSANRDTSKIVEELKKAAEDAKKNVQDKPVEDVDADGNKTTTQVVKVDVTEEKDANGNVNGYTTTTVTEKSVTKTLDKAGDKANADMLEPEEKAAAKAQLMDQQLKKLADELGVEPEPTAEGTTKFAIKDGYYEVKPTDDGFQLIKVVTKHDEATAQDVITLPERPLESVTTAENGDEIRVEVQDRLDASGNPIGYVKITTVTSLSGSVATKTEVLSGTKTSASTTTADSTHTITTSVTDVKLDMLNSTITEWTKITESETKTVNAPKKTVTVTLGTSHVTSTNSPAWESVGGVNGITHGDTADKTEDEKWGTLNTKGIYVYPNHSSGTNENPFYVEGHSKSVGSAHIFKIGEKGSNDTFFAYCADWDITPQSGNPRKEGVEVDKAGYFKDDATAKKIAEIALNGFWGSDNGVGSLEYVKNLGNFDGLTANGAMVATQAAIWVTGGTRGSNGLGQNQDLNDGDMAKNFNKLSESEKTAAMAYYEYLKARTGNYVGTDTKPIIDTSNAAASATVTVGKKTEKGTYNTDISFKLKETPLNGNFKVTLKDSKGNTKTVTVSSSDVKDGTINLTGLDLAAGKIDIEVGGFSYQEKAAYLYQAVDKNGNLGHTNGQTMIGIKQRTVNAKLAFDLTFTVAEEDAEIKTVNKTGTQTKDTYAFVIDAAPETTDVTETHIETETLRYWDARTVETNTYEYGDDDDDDDDDDVVTGDDDDDDVVTGDDDDDDTTTVEGEPTPLAEAPEIQDEVTVPEENVPLAEAPEEEEEVEIPEEDVPLAEVPATGDISGAWYAMTILAGCGLAVLTLRKKEQDA